MTSPPARAGGSCTVDESQTALVPDAAAFFDQLQYLHTVPVRGETEHACGGYTGDPIPVYSGASTALSYFGDIQEGHSFGLSHEPLIEGWEFVEIFNSRSEVVGFGWVQLQFDFGEDCERFAG